MLGAAKITIPKDICTKITRKKANDIDIYPS